MKDIVLPGDDPGGPKTKTINGRLGGTIGAARRDAVGTSATSEPTPTSTWPSRACSSGNSIGMATSFRNCAGSTRYSCLRARDRPSSSLRRPCSGLYAVRTREVDTGPKGDPNDTLQLATLVVEGVPVDSAALQARPGDPAVAIDTTTAAQLAATPITRRRTMTFSETDYGNTFFIDGRIYDVSRDDVVVHLGDVEEWTLVNASAERHVFHIHQMDFLVKSINNQDIDETGLRDVIDMPYAQNGVSGEVKIIVPFTDPLMVGRFVFHCHIVEHEDGGMMANVVVLPPGASAMPAARMRTMTARTSADTIRAALRGWLADYGIVAATAVDRVGGARLHSGLTSSVVFYFST